MAFNHNVVNSDIGKSEYNPGLIKLSATDVDYNTAADFLH